jgi:hypothetical protein
MNPAFRRQYAIFCASAHLISIAAARSLAVNAPSPCGRSAIQSAGLSKSLCSTTSNNLRSWVTHPRRRHARFPSCRLASSSLINSTSREKLGCDINCDKLTISRNRSSMRPVLGD